MDLETAQTNATAKFPILKQGEYEMWRLRIEQYFQVQDYALWDNLRLKNYFVTTEEKAQKKNDVIARNNTTNLSDATIYAFLANQPNGSRLVHEDLEQIHEDDLEEMDLKWQLALLRLEQERLLPEKLVRRSTIPMGVILLEYDKS
ncbi:hypothetical protein Tco_0389566 [Tanacetum coccineum]